MEVQSRSLGGISTVKGRTTPAKKLPYWLWYVIAKSLGIKLHPQDNPIVSAILHIITFGSAAGLFSTNAWFSGYNIVSVNTKSDILDGTVSIMVISFFCGLGVYSHRLAYRLFIHPKFLDMLRLHSKTIMKLNSAFVIFVILVVFAAVLNVSTFNNTYPFNSNSTGVSTEQEGLFEASDITNITDINPCQVVGVAVQVCQVYWASQITFSVFFVMWNVLVAVVLVSVARTQTINIRRFLRELERDATLLDRKLGHSFSRNDNLNQFVWLDDDSLVDCFLDKPGDGGEAKQGPTQPDTQETPNTTNDSFQDLQLRIGGDVEEVQSASSISEGASRFRQLEEEEEDVNEEDRGIAPHIMSSQEIMHKYWKLNMNVRLASIALQRWMCSITALITTSSAIRMVYWLSHTPTIYGVFMFILPLFLLPLLASSYAEVNYEGSKILQSILPLPDRVQLFQYLYGQPVQMTIYGHAISYGTIGTVVAGILAAFASKILLQEINGI